MRNELEQRPVLAVAFGLLVGAATPQHIVVAAFLLVALWAARPLGSRAAMLAAFCVGYAIGPRGVAATSFERQYVQYDCRVATVPRLYDFGSSCEVVLESGDRLRLDWGGEPEVVLGDRLRVRGLLLPVREGMETFSGLRNIRGTLRARAAGVQVLERGSAAAAWASLWRKEFVSHTARTLSPRAAEIVDALCFNVDSRLDQRYRDNLQRTGTTHIVSASGLHVFILAFALQAALALLPIPRWAQLILLGCVLAAYAGATGLRPPVVRAASMAFVLAGAYLFRREADLLCALGGAAAAYLLWQPDSVYDIGFQLSFLTVGALALCCRFSDGTPRKPVARLKSQVKDVSKASLVASAASAPLVAYHFGVVSLVSVLANVLIALVLAPIIVTSLLSLACWPVFDEVSLGLMRVIVEPLAGWVLWVVETLGPLSVSALSVPEFSPFWLVPIYAPFLLLWRWRARPA